MNEQHISEAIEALLVERNPRQMAVAQKVLVPGYYLRGARYLYNRRGNIIIGTGFPVGDTFETDGPVGAMALYDALQTLGARPLIACGAPLSHALASHYRVLELQAWDEASAQAEAKEQLQALQPDAIVAIERPGLAADGRYYNMHGDDISPGCHRFDAYISEASCPTIAIGDGGNEIGMGNIADRLREFDVPVSVTRCDELLVADVSNWGAYGLVALLGLWSGRDLLQALSPVELLKHVCAHGGVDGVTGESSLTEDGWEPHAGLQIIARLRTLTNFVQR